MSSAPSGSAGQNPLARRSRGAVLTLLAGLTLLACSSVPPTTSSRTMMASTAPMAAAQTAQQVAWAARPAFTHKSATAEQAYAYALANPEILQWIPCYCGCGAMGHRSNLDCYIKPTGDGSIVFEEHASYCQICAEITLRTKQLIESGATIRQARTAIDAEFGGGVPGTDTGLPSA
jgi:hypothetical protein